MPALPPELHVSRLGRTTSTCSSIPPIRKQHHGMMAWTSTPNPTQHPPHRVNHATYRLQHQLATSDSEWLAGMPATPLVRGHKSGDQSHAWVVVCDAGLVIWETLSFFLFHHPFLLGRPLLSSGGNDQRHLISRPLLANGRWGGKLPDIGPLFCMYTQIPDRDILHSTVALLTKRSQRKSEKESLDGHSGWKSSRSFGIPSQFHTIVNMHG